MLHLIPAPLHRAGLTLAHAVRIRWWQWRKPLLIGCRVLAFDEAERVLLIRHSYGSGRWMLPGGGVGRGEDPLAAGIRELAEETACTLSDPILFGQVEEPLHGTTNRVHLITGTASGTLQGDGREVIEATFFALDALPPDLSHLVDRYLAEWVIAATAARQGQSAAG